MKNRTGQISLILALGVVLVIVGMMITTHSMKEMGQDLKPLWVNRAGNSWEIGLLGTIFEVDTSTLEQWIPTASAMRDKVVDSAVVVVQTMEDSFNSL